ncbi:MAG: hypothetical protein KDA44_10455, partial [Planctomycetales bacterium]|nr:hypothetical protein [Planctomycetales bacterium]
MSFTTRTWSAACAVLMIAVGAQANAALLVYEPFDYAQNSEITGKDGGAGFSAAWTGRANNLSNVPAGSTSVQGASLAHPTLPGSLPTVGGSALLTGANGTSQPAREFSAAAVSAINNASTVWISFLAQRQGTPNPDWNGGVNQWPRGTNVSLFDIAADDEKTGVGNSSSASDNTWSIIPDGGGGNREGAYSPAGGVAGGGPDTPGASPFPFEELQWVVLRIDYDQPGGEDMYMWLSPDPGSEPSLATADAQVLAGDVNYRTLEGITGLRPFLGNESPGSADPNTWRPAGVLAFDEFRVGTAYADMTATRVVPEPMSLAMA